MKIMPKYIFSSIISSNEKTLQSSYNFYFKAKYDTVTSQNLIKIKDQKQRQKQSKIAINFSSDEMMHFMINVKTSAFLIFNSLLFHVSKR